MTEKDVLNQDGELFDQERAGTVQDVAQEQKQVATVQPKATVPVAVSMTNQELLTYAVTNDRLDMLDKVIALKNAEEDRAARIEFEKHFSEMQKEFEAVKKTRKGQFNKYADINDILAVYGPILSRNGFSWSFPEEEVEGKEGWKRVFCVIRGFGHSEKTPFLCPPPPENKGATAIQKEAGNTTFGKRMAFCSAVGVFLEDDDKDGAYTFEDGVLYSQHIILIRESKTIQELQAAFKTAYDSLSGNVEGQRIVCQAKDEMKKKFKGASSGTAN